MDFLKPSLNKKRDSLHSVNLGALGPSKTSLSQSRKSSVHSGKSNSLSR